MCTFWVQWDSHTWKIREQYNVATSDNLSGITEERSNKCVEYKEDSRRWCCQEGSKGWTSEEVWVGGGSGEHASLAQQLIVFRNKNLLLCDLGKGMWLGIHSGGVEDSSHIQLWERLWRLFYPQNHGFMSCITVDFMIQNTSEQGKPNPIGKL